MLTVLLFFSCCVAFIIRLNWKFATEIDCRDINDQPIDVNSFQTIRSGRYVGLCKAQIESRVNPFDDIIYCLLYTQRPERMISSPAEVWSRVKVVSEEPRGNHCQTWQTRTVRSLPHSQQKSLLKLSSDDCMKQQTSAIDFHVELDADELKNDVWKDRFMVSEKKAAAILSLLLLCVKSELCADEGMPLLLEFQYTEKTLQHFSDTFCRRVLTTFSN